MKSMPETISETCKKSEMELLSQKIVNKRTLNKSEYYVKYELHPSFLYKQHFYKQHKVEIGKK